MITKMKKLTFLVTVKEYDQFIADIQQIGVVHVQELQSGSTSPEFEAGKDLAARYKKALAALDFAQETYKVPQAVAWHPVDFSQIHDVAARGLQVLQRVENLQEKENSLKHQIDEAEKNIGRLEPWGEYDAGRFSQLVVAGYQVNFFICPSKMFKAEWQEKYYATAVNELENKTYFVTFSPEKPDITAESIELPSRPLSSFVEQKKHLEADLKAVQAEYLRINAEEREVLQAAQVENENAISLSRVHLSTASIAADAVKMLVGWVPEEREAELSQYLDSHKIFYESEHPTLEDDVPVQIKDGKYSSLFEPILRMYSLPRYRDLDILPFLAPFFMLFFGLCMGDAGYGLLILVASAIVRRKLKPEQKSYGTLGMVLGGMTIVCGLLTGSFFGIDLSKQNWAFLAPFKDYFINDNHKIFGYSPMMVISVIIGFIQVMVGMVLAACKAARNYGWKYGIGKFSWVVALVTAVAAFGLPVCGVAIPQFVQYVLCGLLALSVIGIFFLNSPGKNVFLNFGTGLWNTYGMATGLLGDLLSYIRLYALGLTGGVLGGVFNSLALMTGQSMPWYIGWLPMLLVLLIGHGINFGLCMISSFVHPMRLTFVEFFKNADFEGGGKEYSPFRVKTYHQ